MDASHVLPLRCPGFVSRLVRFGRLDRERSDVRFAAAIDTEVSRPSPLRRVRGALAAGRPDDPLAGLANRGRAWELVFYCPVCGERKFGDD